MSVKPTGSGDDSIIKKASFPPPKSSDSVPVADKANVLPSSGVDKFDTVANIGSHKKEVSLPGENTPKQIPPGAKVPLGTSIDQVVSEFKLSGPASEMLANLAKGNPVKNEVKSYGLSSGASKLLEKLVDNGNTAV